MKNFGKLSLLILVIACGNVIASDTAPSEGDVFSSLDEDYIRFEEIEKEDCQGCNMSPEYLAYRARVLQKVKGTKATPMNIMMLFDRLSYNAWIGYAPRWPEDKLSDEYYKKHIEGMAVNVRKTRAFKVIIKSEPSSAPNVQEP
jgi:hypothetical protein